MAGWIIAWMNWGTGVPISRAGGCVIPVKTISVPGCKMWKS